MKNKPHYLVVDCNNLCWRIAHATMGKFTLNTNVIYGFFNCLAAYQRIVESSDFIFCWDHGPSKRKEVYSSYKSNRGLFKEKDENAYNDIIAQMNFLKYDLLSYVGFRNNCFCSGYEADDLIASVVKEPGTHTIVSCDKDLYQLLSKRVQILLSNKNKIYTRWDFTLEYGIEPKKWWKVKAISGCKSDNVLGVGGVGEITAVKYLTNKLKDTNKKYLHIESSKDLIKRNKSLVKLPYEGTPEIKLQPDELDKGRWIKVIDKYKIRKLRFFLT